MTATEFFTKQTGRPPKTDSDKLWVAMMAEYGSELLKRFINWHCGELPYGDTPDRIVDEFLRGGSN